MSGPKSLAERLDWMAKNLPGFSDELEEVAAIERNARARPRSSISVNQALVGSAHYAISLESVPSTDGAGALVDARTGAGCQFKTMDAAHSAISQLGFRCTRFSVGHIK